MIKANEQAIREVVVEVLQQIRQTNPPSTYSVPHHESWGVFSSVDQAVDAATDGYKQLAKATLETRAQIVETVKRICFEQAEELGRLEFEETKIGRLSHKTEKLEIVQKVPGIEFLRSDAVSGDNGLTVTEYAPFGVIGTITPVTHSLPTLAGNVVSMIASGNTIVFNPHPGGKNVACEGVKRFNKAIHNATGLTNLITIIEEPTIESAEEIFNHRGIRLLCVTGGTAVARAALGSRKRAIVAGPGNPPVVVDETADLDRAARSIVKGGGYDNNLLCIGEKEVFAVDAIFDKLMQAMQSAGAVRLNRNQMEQLTSQAFHPADKPGGDPILNRDLIGRDAKDLAVLAGINISEDVELIYAETDEHNPYVAVEQMMPFVPFVRCRDVDHAIQLAHKYEHGFGHTAIIHSRNVRNMSIMGRLMDTTLFVKNGPSMAGLGLGGEGYFSYSIATPTGEGVTNPLTFTRQRRCTLVDDLRII